MRVGFGFMQQAEWNDITFGSNSTKIANIGSIRISQGIKIDEQTSESGINKQTIKGFDSENLSITYKAGFPVGLDPRGEYELMRKNTGKQADFILRDKPLSDEPFTLDGVSLSDTVVDNFGRILTGTISLDFSTDSHISALGGKGAKNKSLSKQPKKSSLSLKNQII